MTHIVTWNELTEELNESYPWWKDNGNSDPFRFIWPLIYSKDTIKLLHKVAKNHDWGYYAGHLVGSPHEHLTRRDWDKMYRDYLIRNGHPHIARLHYRHLRLFGWWAWNSNNADMKRMGYHDFRTFCMRRQEKHASEKMAEGYGGS